MIWELPLTGVGVGSYHWLAPDYSRVAFNQELPFDNAQNWWRHQLAELGMLGALPVLAWSIIIAWQTLRGARRARGDHVATVRGLLLGLGLASLLGMPTQDPAVLTAFFLLVAMLAAAGSGLGALDTTSQTRASLSRAWMSRGGAGRGVCGWPRGPGQRQPQRGRTCRPHEPRLHRGPLSGGVTPGGRPVPVDRRRGASTAGETRTVAGSADLDPATRMPPNGPSRCVS